MSASAMCWHCWHAVADGKRRCCWCDAERPQHVEAHGPFEPVGAA